MLCIHNTLHRLKVILFYMLCIIYIIHTIKQKGPIKKGSSQINK